MGGCCDGVDVRGLPRVGCCEGGGRAGQGGEWCLPVLCCLLCGVAGTTDESCCYQLVMLLLMRTKTEPWLPVGLQARRIRDTTELGPAEPEVEVGPQLPTGPSAKVRPLPVHHTHAVPHTPWVLASLFSSQPVFCGMSILLKVVCIESL